MGALGCALWAVAPAQGVDVYGTATSSGETITVDVRADVDKGELRSFAVEVQYDPEIVRLIDVVRNDRAWYLSDGTNRIPYQAPVVHERGSIRILGGHLDAQDPSAGVSGMGTGLASIRFQRLVQRPPKFELNIPDGGNGRFAAFVTTEGEVLREGDGLENANVQPDEDDRDLDGLSDAWEEKYFGDLREADYLDDSDEDGLSNLAEQALGTDPTDPASTFNVEITRAEKGAAIQWDSVADRSYALAYGPHPREMKILAEGLKATPPVNTYLHERPRPESGYYRVLLERP